jgi:hypothetical protein
MQERRIDNRLLCAEMVQLIYRDERGNQRRRIANLEDISLCGVCLQVESRIPDDTRVIIRYGDGQLVGTVRYCSFRDEGYFIGIQFADGCRWSTKHFMPQHLLDPRELVERAMERRQGEPAHP